MFKHTLHVALCLDGVIAEREDGLVCNSFYSSLFPSPLGMDIAHWCMQRMKDRKPRAETSILALRYPVHLLVTDKWLVRHEVPYVRLFVNNKLEYLLASLQSNMPDIVVSDKIEVCEFAYRNIPDCKPILIEDKYNETIWFPRIRSLAAFQRIYEGVAHEKLSTDFSGARMAPDISSF